MRLGIGSAAAPDASLGDLLEAAVRRGLGTLELEEGHGHGLDPNHGGTAAVRDAAARAAGAGLTIAGFRLAPPLPGTDPRGIAGLAAFADALGAPLLVPLGSAADGGDRGLELVHALVDAGHRPVPVLPASGALSRLERLDGVVSGLPVAWDADPVSPDMAGTGAALLRRCGARIRHIRLPGGGPEAVEQAGRGIGPLMTRLALAGYGGTIALVPSSGRFRVIWDAWLGRRGGWGCGGRQPDRSLVSLAVAR